MKPIPSERVGLGLLLFLLAAAPCLAVHPRELVFDSYADFADGTARSVTLSDDGVLAPAPGVVPLASPAAALADQIWAVVPVGDDLLAATSPKGQLLRITSGGKVESAAQFKETHLYALAKNARNEVFVGTSPDGKIYQLGSNGTAKPKLWFDPKAKYIWALAFDKKGNLYAATGTEGKIFKITGEGKGEVFYASDETHIRSLQFDASGNLLAGSAEGGLLYRIAPDGTAVVLASTGRQEVNKIALGTDGAVYFSATGPAHHTAPKAEDAASALRAALLSVAQAAADSSTNAPSVKAAPAIAASSGGASSSQVWRLDASLYPQLLWTTSESILTLDPDPSGGVRAGTGGEGYLYHIDDRGRATRLLQLDGPAITASTPDGQVLASSNPPRLFRIGERYGHGPGIYESDTVDSKGFARWGALRAEGSGSFSLQTRSGNTPKPDQSWYPWADLRQDHIASPSARYLQFKLEIAGGTVDRVILAYLPKNLAPSVDEVDVLPPGVGYISVTPAPPAAQAKSAEQLLDLASGGESPARGATRYQPVQSRGYRTAVWKASDPNDDSLTYVLSVRGEGEKAWRVLAKDLTETVFSWDASGWPDGRYYIKVSASDAADNLPDPGLTDELASRLFVVDNTAPIIKVLSGRSRSVEFTVTDEASGIGSVAVSNDGNDFKELNPADGVLDPRTEKFATKLDAGQILFIRVEDQAGNVSSAQVKPEEK